MKTEHPSYDKVQKLLVAEKDLPANCFSLRRKGKPEEGILMSLDPGPNPKTPWEPHVVVGKHRVNRDKRHECVYHLVAGVHPLLRRANAVPIVREGRQTFYVLCHPGFDELQCSLIKVFFGNSEYGRALTGVSGTASLIADSREVCLVSLLDGQVVYFFFPDTGVRSFRQMGTCLIEESVSPVDMVSLRIVHARNQLLSAKTITDEERKRKRVAIILSGMIGVLHQTTRYPVTGRVLREAVIRDFFFTLSKSKAEIALPMLLEELRVIDKTLLRMLKRFAYVDPRILDVITEE